MEYIVDFKPKKLKSINKDKIKNIENKLINNESLTGQELTYLLDYVIFITRYSINKKMDNFDNKCDLAQSIICYYFNNLKVNSYPCATQKVITNNIIGHSFIVITLLVDNQEKNYLIDPTYIQFFKKNKCNKNNYCIYQKKTNIVLITPDPGYFIKKENINIIVDLLNNGYIELTSKIAQIYGDSFFNTKVGDKFNDKINTISGEIYINSFLKGNEKLSKSIEELENMNLKIK